MFSPQKICQKYLWENQFMPIKYTMYSRVNVYENNERRTKKQNTIVFYSFFFTIRYICSNKHNKLHSQNLQYFKA